MEGGELEKRVNKLRKLSFTGNVAVGSRARRGRFKEDFFFFKLEKSTVFFSAYGNNPVERRT